MFQKDLANDVQSWECQLRRRHVCKARIKILDDQVIERVNQHTHAPNSIKVQTTKIRVAMKRRAETTIDAPQRILSEGLAQAPPCVAVNLPRIPPVGAPRFKNVVITYATELWDNVFERA